MGNLRGNFRRTSCHDSAPGIILPCFGSIRRTALA
jgi:hypothetical protein